MTVKPQKSSLVSRIDGFVIALLEEANGNKLGVSDEGGEPNGQQAKGVDFGQRVQFLAAITRYLAIKNCIDPDEEKDQWSRELDKFHGRGAGGKGRPRKGDTDQGADAPPSDGGSPIPLNAFRPQR